MSFISLAVKFQVVAPRYLTGLLRVLMTMFKGPYRKISRVLVEEVTV